MEINIINMKTEAKRLNILINEYELLYLNLYNELSHFSSCWRDNNSVKFFNNVNLEKMKIRTLVSELNSVVDVYNYIVLQYQRFGNKINFDFTCKSNIVDSYNNYLNKVIDLIYSYEQLDLSFYSDISEKNLLHLHKQKLVKLKNMIELSKRRILDLFDYIEKTEQEIKNKFANIKIELIKENVDVI